MLVAISAYFEGVVSYLMDPALLMQTLLAWLAHSAEGGNW